MKWYEYKMEVDDLHASDELKAKLLAMQPQASAASPAAPAPAAKPKAKKAVRFPLRRVLPVAACLVVCVVGANVLLGVNSFHLGSSGASASSAAAGAMQRSYAAADYGLDTASENSLDIAAYSDESTASYGSAGSSDSVSVTESEAHQSEIIYTAHLTLETKDYDTAREALSSVVSSAGGYVESSDENTYSGSSRSLSLTVRVPQENYSDFLAAAAEVGNLTYRSETAEDVTTQYMDIEARLANLEAQRTRLQELQANAATLSDLLEIESQLSNVQYELESWQSQLDWYSSQVTRSTVYISLDEVVEYTPDAESFGERISAAFRNGWSNFLDGSQQAVVWVISHWPVVILLAAAVVVYVLVRRARRRG